jgi:Ca2+-binding RTX toxin-like protein
MLLSGTSSVDSLVGTQADDAVLAASAEAELEGNASGFEKPAAELPATNPETPTVQFGSPIVVIIGTAGDDKIDGSWADDRIYGGAGNDTLDGGYGSDVVNGDEGRDTIEGGYQNDRVDGGAGDDRIDAGYGDDTLAGGAGDDQMEAGYGNDTAYGGDGDDRIGGGFGNDQLYGAAGNDTLDGLNDDDVLSGYTGDDTLTGGPGADVFVFWGSNNGRDRVLDFNASEGDVLRFDHSYLRNAADLTLAMNQTAEGAEIAWTDAEGVDHGVLLLGVHIADVDVSRVEFR